MKYRAFEGWRLKQTSLLFPTLAHSFIHSLCQNFHGPFIPPGLCSNHQVQLADPTLAFSPPLPAQHCLCLAHHYFLICKMEIILLFMVTSQNCLSIKYIQTTLKYLTIMRQCAEISYKFDNLMFLEYVSLYLAYYFFPYIILWNITHAP